MPESEQNVGQQGKKERREDLVDLIQRVVGGDTPPNYGSGFYKTSNIGDRVPPERPFGSDEPDPNEA